MYNIFDDYRFSPIVPLNTVFVLITLMQARMKRIAWLICFLPLLVMSMNAEAALINGLCVFWQKERLVQKKTCMLDYYNSGLIQIITNNGTLNFKLHDSRINQYNLNGQIYQLEGDVFDGGTFFLVRDPSTSIHWIDFHN